MAEDQRSGSPTEATVAAIPETTPAKASHEKPPEPAEEVVEPTTEEDDSKGEESSINVEDGSESHSPRKETETVSTDQDSAPTESQTSTTAVAVPEEEVDAPGVEAESIQDKELPPQDDSPISATPSIQSGIPLPLSTDPPSSTDASSAAPKPPNTPKRTSSINAPTTTNPTPPQRTPSGTLQVPNGSGHPISSMVFVVQALESIAQSKESKKRKPLSDAIQRALDAIRASAPEPPADPGITFEPLRLASEVPNTQVVTTALDCISKLISYSYFSVLPPSTPSEEDREEHAHPAPLIDKAIETICECFQGDSTPDIIQLQIIKALLAAVLNDKVVVHGAGLLKAVRQTYNIFLLSRNSANQMTAQGTLTQMVHTVFERVKTRIALKEAQERNESRTALSISVSNKEIDADSDSVSVKEQETGSGSGDNRSQEKITLQSFENRKSFDDARIQDSTATTVTHTARRGRRRGRSTDRNSLKDEGLEDEDEIFVKDAFLVFRAMCKLSIKTLPAEQLADLKSHGMRSKLLSLHLIHAILKNHMIVFLSPLSRIRSSSSVEPTGFVHAIKQYLCLSLSRNAASAVNLVFEVSCEIFWLMLSSMRDTLKKEIEVFVKEIYLNIIENRHSSAQQKQYLLTVWERLCSDPRALVEIYLNYDCDGTALDNMYQRVIEHLSRLATSPVHISDIQLQQYMESQRNGPTSKPHNLSLPPSLATATIASTSTPPVDPTFPVEYALKRQSLECLIAVLRSLVTWSQKNLVDALQQSADSDMPRESVDNSSPRVSMQTTPIPSTPQGELASEITDDPNQLEQAKQRKTALMEAIRLFGYKPKKGIKELINRKFIESNDPVLIAKFLLRNNSMLDKAAIGEYLGEADPENVAAMHAFVDMMDFTKSRFVDALRRFLQSFRLPGEAQKIDRYMLKFAERYISGNPNAFANADTAYVLSYSVIMLNTDQHSSKIKEKRMTAEDFIKNNRGINDNGDLPDDYLVGIYEEIKQNEIVLKEERENAAKFETIGPSGGIISDLGRTFANAGRDLDREAYVHASELMASKTEQLFKNLLRSQRRSGNPNKFIAAVSSKHVGPMFEVTWMSLLSSLSGSAQESSDVETIRQCMEGFKLAIRIACVFELETPRLAFVSALAKFTHLNNLSEMKAKNVEALKALLEVAQSEGNLLKSSWKDVLTCISQLERFQLISSGVDEGAVPDVTKGKIVQPDAEARSRSSMQSTRPTRPLRTRAPSTTHYIAEVAEESRSREVVIAVDRIFANSSRLSGDAIVHFVHALSEVSWEEIQSSGESENPRMFSLQKLVEISYYNMNRIRVEWSNIWNILGEHFNQVGCHSNTSVVFFALDSLRQLSMRFLDIEELPHFKFQKDFLKPFEHVMANSTVVPVKDMVLRCLNQMLQARGDNIRSGWRTMFGVFQYSAKETYDSIVNLGFDTVKRIYRERFGVIIQQGAFADMIVCLTEFAKNQRFQKVSLQSIETLKGTVPIMLACPECPLSHKEEDGGSGESSPVRSTRDDPMVKFWFPVLFGFHDILMTGEDLEARTRALGYLFDTLRKYGGDFPPDFWDTVCHELLFPIFIVLKSRSEMVQFNSQEAVGLWLSTTMIQALRKLIDLLTHYFDKLERLLDGFLELLVTCICQENDTIARIGSSCLQQLILQSVHKLQPEHWSKIVQAFVQLFETTTADQLFTAVPTGRAMSMSGGISATVGANEIKGAFNDAVIDEEVDEENSLKLEGLTSGASEDDPDLKASPADAASKDPLTAELEDYRPQNVTQQPVVTAARRRFFNKIITKCVLQLLMIETVSELFQNPQVYDKIPSTELLKLMGLLKKSFSFARRFNGDKELRMRLWREGFMKQPPNLLKQESGSAATYVSILLRMYDDDKPERRDNRSAIEDALIPLCVDIIRGYVVLDEDTQHRNIVAWRPVVVDVIEGYTNFPRPDFERHVDTFYPLAVELLNRELGPDVRLSLQNLFRRVGEVKSLGAVPKTRHRSESEISMRNGMSSKSRKLSFRQ